MTVDVLMIGAHPDDVEFGVGGTALALKKQGVSFAIVDMTRGDMSSRGTVQERLSEANAAAEYMGAVSRETLDLPDGGLVDDVESRMIVARLIRKYRPTAVLAPFWKDLHNDHVATGLMTRNSLMYCTMARLDCNDAPYRPAAFLYYLLHEFSDPTFIVDISETFDDKVRAVKLHRSQFAQTAEEAGRIPLGIGDYFFHLESRNRYMGALANVRFGEGLIADRPRKVTALKALLQL